MEVVSGKRRLASIRRYSDAGMDRNHELKIKKMNCFYCPPAMPLCLMKILAGRSGVRPQERSGGPERAENERPGAMEKGAGQESN
jgi:hypothetical protein